MRPWRVPFFEDYAPEAHGTAEPRLVVRPAAPGDVPTLAAVARTRGPQPASFDERLAQWVADDERRVAAAVVGERGPAREAGPLVGWAMAAHRAGHDDAPDGWYVGWLVVDPSWRRRGVAGALLDDLLAWTRARGDALFSLVNVQNLASLDLHAGRGFRELARAGSFAGVTFTGGTGLLLEARTT